MRLQRLGGGAIAVIASLVGVVGLATAPVSASTAAAVVGFHGYALRVPSSWSVIDLEKAPSTCVRLDRHAVYVGRPGADQVCPARLLGQTEAVVVQPLAGAVVPAGTVWLRGGVTPASVPATTDHRVSLAIPAAGALVTGSYGRDRAALARVLSSATLTPGARPQAAGAAHASPQAAGAQVTAPGTFAGRGFDACSAPSSSAMQAWLSSPYRAIGVYIGGVNRACSQPNLTASWVSAQDAAGWHLFPIYVGLQAPCSGIGSVIDPATANAQGQSAAQDAAAQAQGLGMATGSVVYDDMEAYARGGSCTQGVLDFLAGWTTGLHAAGYGSGVYSSSASGITDLVSVYGGSYPSPDDIYFARWNNVADTTDPAVPAADWPNHQRIHQYAGGHNETYSGVTINIDNDELDVAAAASAAAVASAPSQAFTVGGQQHFLGRGTDGSLAHSWWDPAGGLSDDTWAPANSIVGEPLAYVTTSVGTQQHAWAIDAGGNLQHWWWGTNDPPHTPQHDTWSSAASDGITLTGTPAGFTFGTEQHVLARDTAGRLQHWWWLPNGTAAGSMNHDTWDASGDVAGDPVAIAIGATQHVYFVSAGGTLQHWSWSAGTGLVSETWASGVAGKPAADGVGDQQNVFVLDTGGALQHYAWSPADPPGQPEHTTLATGSGATLAGTPAGFDDGSLQHVFARDSAGNLQHWSFSATSPVENDTWDGAGDMAGDPVALLIGADRHVFFVDRQGRLSHWFWDPNVTTNNGLMNGVWPTPVALAAG